MMPPSYQSVFVLSVLAAIIIATRLHRMRGQGTITQASNRFIQARLRALEVRARQLEIANEKLQRLSNEDSLTGIANRRHFDENIEIEWRQARRVGAPLSLIIIDIDNFKAFNDIYRHRFGDECLTLLARALREVVNRPGDFVARYGGEEFVVLLADTSAHGASDVAEAIRARVERLKIRIEDQTRDALVRVELA